MTRWRTGIVVLLVVVTALLAVTPGAVRSLWPPLVALVVIVLTRRALIGLLVGAYAGAVLLAGGDPWTAYLDLLRDHLAPSLASAWKMGAILFTLILGGFAAVLDATGGFAALLHRLAPPQGRAARRFELAAMGLGLICFFDGLANSMLVGRVGRQLADRCGTARVKLAYIVDSTSSAVACVAPLSTWIAFQLAMITEGYRLAGLTVNPYTAFLRSLPYNFHCWLTLIMLGAAIWWRYAPGPMAGFERAIRPSPGRAAAGPRSRGPAAALVPLLVLLVAFGAGFLILGSPRPILPLAREKLVAAVGSDVGPLVMVLAGLVATVTAGACLPGRWSGRAGLALPAFGRGTAAMVAPVFVLVAAWMLGSVVQALGTADLIAHLVDRAGSPALVPLLTFLTGALVSFTTGTSWGTMGLLFPLAIPAAASVGAAESLLPATVAAVFSGAVFGDHCSPFSDTTIVTAVACEVEPHDHVRTQLPYALITAAVSALAGFLPAGLGLAPVWSLLAGTLVIVALARGGVRWRSGRPAPSGSGARGAPPPPAS
ncbi:MAG: Na+/H+ antiporter NhaC family protein [Candidatus Krumholzibacteriia bacterium]